MEMYCECEVSEEESVNYVNFSRLIRQREREMILETIREIEEEREKQEEIERQLQKVSILGVESLLLFSAYTYSRVRNRRRAGNKRRAWKIW